MQEHRTTPMIAEDASFQKIVAKGPQIPFLENKIN